MIKARCVNCAVVSEMKDLSKCPKCGHKDFDQVEEIVEPEPVKPDPEAEKKPVPAKKVEIIKKKNFLGGSKK